MKWLREESGWGALAAGNEAGLQSKEEAAQQRNANKK
jgi:hypothetical protein